MRTTYLEVSHLEQILKRGLGSGDFWPISVNWDKSQTWERGSEDLCGYSKNKVPPTEDECRHYP